MMENIGHVVVNSPITRNVPKAFDLGTHVYAKVLILQHCASIVVSFSSSLVGFLGFHPYMGLFSFFVTCSCYIFGLLFRNGKEKISGSRGRGEDAWSMKHDNMWNFFIHIEQRIIINSNASTK